MRKAKPIGMKHTRRSWTSKLREDMQPVVGNDPKGRGKMLLPTPLMMAREISSIAFGRVRTISDVRQRMARKHHADLTCPLMSGIFYNIIAGAAEEHLAEGKPALAPYWRVVRDDYSLSPKTPEGPQRQAEHLRAEGHTLEMRRGKIWLKQPDAT